MERGGRSEKMSVKGTTSNSVRITCIDVRSIVQKEVVRI